MLKILILIPLACVDSSQCLFLVCLWKDSLFIPVYSHRSHEYTVLSSCIFTEKYYNLYDLVVGIRFFSNSCIIDCITNYDKRTSFYRITKKRVNITKRNKGSLEESHFLWDISSKRLCLELREYYI